MATTSQAFALSLSLALLSACAHEAAQAPVPDLATSGPPVATYKLPAGDPKGTLHVVSLGTEALPAGSDGQAVAYLHLRLAALNGSDPVTWSFDPNEQVLMIGSTAVSPAFSEAKVGATRGPVLTLERAARGYLDLYYPAPAGDVSDLSLSWRLRRGGQVVALATPLRRIDGAGRGYAYYQPADDPHLAWGTGMGSWWWQDYYFWRNANCWWSYPRAHFHARHPSFQVARPAGVATGEQPTRDPAWSQRESATSFWRDSSQESRDARDSASARSESTSSWRNPPPPPPPPPPVSSDSGSSSSFSAPAPSAPAPSSPPPPASDGGGDGKSGWRGGSGP